MPLVAALLVVAVLAATPSGQAPAAPNGADPAIIAVDTPALPDHAGDTPELPGPAGRLPPGPLIVESAPESPAGLVRLEPGVAQVRAAAGQSVQPELLIVNGAESPLDLALTVDSVAPGPDGAPTLVDTTENTASTVPSAATWVSLPAAQLHLDPGEQARLRPTVSVPAVAEPGGYVAALRAATRPDSPTGPPSRRLGRLPGDAAPVSGAPQERREMSLLRSPKTATEMIASPELVAFLLVKVPDIRGGTSHRATATATLTRRGLAGAEARVRLDSQQSEVVAGWVKVSGWWGATLVDVAIPPTVVLFAVPRSQEVGFRAPVLPGPYDLTTSLETSTGETLSARATAWLWNPLATLFVALLIVLVVAVLVVTRAAVLRRQP